MYRNLIKQHIIVVSIILFLIIFFSVHMTKPLCFYNNDGSIRQFGIGYKNKTILPIWLLSIFLGILCYLSVLFFVTYPKLF